MNPNVILAVLGVFVAVAVLAGYGVAELLARLAPAKRRLQELATPQGTPGPSVSTSLALDAGEPSLQRISRLLPKSPKEMTVLQRRLARAGIHSRKAAVVYSAAELVTPVLLAAPFLVVLGLRRGILPAAIIGFVGYLLPGFYLSRKIEKRKKAITNGLPDALDLLIVCVEAGLGLDQAILKASEELKISHPAVADEMRMINTEIRAGKSRLEAFKNFSERTKVDEVRSLVAMLVQTDRFGTSIAQALRVQADVARTKRRQRAEEKAQKLGVKLVFPLVFCLFPAMYVVTLGAAVIKFIRFFAAMNQ